MDEPKGMREGVGGQDDIFPTDRTNKGFMEIRPNQIRSQRDLYLIEVFKRSWGKEE